MPATPFDSTHLSALFDAGATARLFGDGAEIRAMMLVLGALAEAQGAAGVIPETAAAAIARAAREVQIDPESLAGATGANGVTLPGLVTAFRAAMQAPEHAQYIHWGATSQDIHDTALMLRLRQALMLAEDELGTVLAALADTAEAEAGTPMAARTYGQAATPTSFGAQAAGWGWPLLRARDALPGLRDGALWVSLSGAAGTASMLGRDPAAIRADVAQGLGLGDPGRGWHADRGPVLAIAGWFADVSAALGKLGEDVILAAQSGVAEIAIGGAGASSTMPQKQNPVAASALVALARHNAGLSATLRGAALHRQARDGAAWFTEWLVLPQLVLGTAAALRHAARLVPALAPDRGAMRAGIETDGGLIFAEALSFALAASMPRPDAQASVKALCAETRATGTPLPDLARAAHPDLPPDLFDPDRALGTAPDEARAFARAVRGRAGFP